MKERGASAPEENPQASSQRHKILAAALQHLLIKPAHRILREMRRMPMRVRRSRVLVLLVDENRVRVALNAMRNID